MKRVKGRSLTPSPPARTKPQRRFRSESIISPPPCVRDELMEHVRKILPALWVAVGFHESGDFRLRPSDRISRLMYRATVRPQLHNCVTGLPGSTMGTCSVNPLLQ